MVANEKRSLKEGYKRRKSGLKKRGKDGGGRVKHKLKMSNKYSRAAEQSPPFSLHLVFQLNRGGNQDGGPEDILGNVRFWVSHTGRDKVKVTVTRLQLWLPLGKHRRPWPKLKTCDEFTAKFSINMHFVLARGGENGYLLGESRRVVSVHKK